MRFLDAAGSGIREFPKGQTSRPGSMRNLSSASSQFTTDFALAAVPQPATISPTSGARPDTGQSRRAFSATGCALAGSTLAVSGAMSDALGFRPEGSTPERARSGGRHRPRRLLEGFRQPEHAAAYASALRRLDTLLDGRDSTM